MYSKFVNTNFCLDGNVDIDGIQLDLQGVYYALTACSYRPLNSKVLIVQYVTIPTDMRVHSTMYPAASVCSGEFVIPVHNIYVTCYIPAHGGGNSLSNAVMDSLAYSCLSHTLL